MIQEITEEVRDCDSESVRILEIGRTEVDGRCLVEPQRESYEVSFCPKIDRPAGGEKRRQGQTTVHLFLGPAIIRDGPHGPIPRDNGDWKKRGIGLAQAAQPLPLSTHRSGSTRQRQIDTRRCASSIPSKDSAIRQSIPVLAF